jgi:hypothetical protein
MTTRRFTPPWRADKIPSGYVVRRANGQAFAYIYSRDNEDDALQFMRRAILRLENQRRRGVASEDRGARAMRE